MAGIAAGRRTASAFPAFVQTYGYDAYAFAPQPIAGIGALPDVSRTTLLRGPAAGTPTCSCGKAINVSDFGLAELQPKDLGQFVKLVDGRMPDQSKPGEVLVSFTFAHDVGVGVGTRLRVPLYARGQRHAIETQSNATPKGPTVRLRVVGIEAADMWPAGRSGRSLWAPWPWVRLWRCGRLSWPCGRIRRGLSEKSRAGQG